MAEEANTMLLNIGKGFSGNFSEKQHFNPQREFGTSPKPVSRAKPFVNKTSSNESKRKLDDESEASPSKKPSNQFTVISSLFNSNPRIPQISRQKFQPIEEEVFSSQSFKDLNCHPFMISNLEQSFGATQLTEVQKKAIPSIMKQKDVLVKSQTGSGKTLAYAVPVVETLHKIKPNIQRSSGVFALVIVPTRELAIQSYDCFVKLVKPYTWIVPGCLMGGEKKKSEKNRIRKGINILVSTPGRLLDHMENTSNLNLKTVQWLILDEADRLLDLGYEKDVATIINQLDKQLENKRRQTLMLSATLTAGVKELAGLALNNPDIIDITADAAHQTDTLGALVTPKNLKQYYVIAPMKLRLMTLATFILWKCKFSDERKVLIFMSTQDMVDFHTQLFRLTLKKTLNTDQRDDSNDEDSKSESEDELDIFQLHGNMVQQERTEVFKQFKEADCGVLISTDVAARGLHLPKVDWIVQYSAPICPADYVHRVGRTARIGAQGNALLFLLPSEAKYVQLLESSKIRLNEMTIDSIIDTLAYPFGRKTTKKRFSTYNSAEEAATGIQLKFENLLLSKSDVLNLAKKAYISYVRAYASYPVDVRFIFNFKEIHLGHVAKSLALRETPSNLGAFATREGKRFKEKYGKRQPEFRNKLSAVSGLRSSSSFHRKPAAVSEFDSGLEGIAQQSKKKKKHHTGSPFQKKKKITNKKKLKFNK